MTSLLMNFVLKHLIVVASVASIGIATMVMYTNWKSRIEEKGARNALDKVQEQNVKATRAAIRASDNSGRPAKLPNDGWCGEGYRCPGRD